MALFKNRAGRFDDPVSTSEDFLSGGIPAGSKVYGLFFGAVRFDFKTEEHMTAEQLCNYIDQEYGQHITPDCGLDLIRPKENGYELVIGR